MSLQVHAIKRDIVILQAHVELRFATSIHSAAITRGTQFVPAKRLLKRRVLFVFVDVTTMTWMDSPTAMATVMISMRM